MHHIYVLKIDLTKEKAHMVPDKHVIWRSLSNLPDCTEIHKQISNKLSKCPPILKEPTSMFTIRQIRQRKWFSNELNTLSL